MTTPRPTLDEIEARLAAATPGPWLLDTDSDVQYEDGPLMVWPTGLTAQGHSIAEFEVVSDADADLIANAPADLRYLLNVARAAEAFWAVYYYDVGHYEGATPEFTCIKTEDAIRLEPLADALTEALSPETESSEIVPSLSDKPMKDWTPSDFTTWYGEGTGSKGKEGME